VDHHDDGIGLSSLCPGLGFGTAQGRRLVAVRIPRFETTNGTR
jgi:hypothetical protein